MPFDRNAAIRAVNFFEQILRHTSDEWAGKPFLLAPWQERAISQIYGRVDEDGNRIIRQIYIETPKKTGKTEFAAGLVLLTLLMDKNLGCQVYGAAAAQRQALNVFRAAHTMVNLSPVLKKHFRILSATSRILKRSDPNSFYAAVAADGDLSDGVNPSCVIADEVHRWRTRKQMENWDVLTKGSITRKEGLVIAITTAGVQNESPLAFRLHEKVVKIQQGIVEDPGFYGKIYAADPTDDWTKESTWIKANPSLKENGGFLDIAKIREQYVSALTDPEGQRSFKRYFLNLWDQKEKLCIDMAQWDRCAGDWKAEGLLPRAPEQKIRSFRHEYLQRFFGRRCWAGIDLSLTTDLTAVTFVFPPLPGEEGYFDLLPFFYTPKHNLKNRELRDGVPYRKWAELGFLELADDKCVDYRDVQARLEWGAEMFDLQAMMFDRWNSRQISTMLIDKGYNCEEVQQGYATLNEPTHKFLELVATAKLRHGGHPILRWNASCLATKQSNDAIMFTKPERDKSTARIDGISAAVNALVKAMVIEPDREPQIFTL